MGSIIIKKISFVETFPVRSVVLRQGKPIATCYFDGDELNDTVHFGLFYHETLIGVASVFKVKSDLFSDEIQYQLRGMAVLESFHGMGFGGMLLNEVLQYVETKYANILWFNARKNAVNFYKKYNFRTFGKPFVINDIGIHYVMYMSFVG